MSEDLTTQSRTYPEFEPPKRRPAPQPEVAGVVRDRAYWESQAQDRAVLNAAKEIVDGAAQDLPQMRGEQPVSHPFEQAKEILDPKTNQALSIHIAMDALSAVVDEAMRNLPPDTRTPTPAERMSPDARANQHPNDAA